MKAIVRGRAWSLGAALAGALGAGACQDPLVDPAVVIGPRVIGARVRAELAPEIAEPRAGQGATIEWLVLADRPGTFRARAIWCRAAPSSLGTPRCEGEPFAEASALGAYDGALALSFQVPATLEVGAAWLAWLGSCESAEPTFDAAAGTFSCPGEAALSAVYRGFVPGESQNQNPSLADDALSLDAVAWGPAEADSERSPREPCRGSTLPSLSAGAEAVISFELGGDDREPLVAPPGQYAAHARESLVYTHVASHPGLTRAFSAIDYDAEVPAFELFFDGADLLPGPDGETFIFHLLVRDERGGVDWLRREACLLPPDP